MNDFGMIDESPDENELWYQEEADRRAANRRYLFICEYCGHTWKGDGRSLFLGGDEACPNCKKLWNRLT